MKRAILLIISCIMLAGLTACGTKTPEKAVDGTPWNTDWIRLGPALGVEEPGHGLTLRDEKSAKNMFYTAWSIGEAQVKTNSSGAETNVYDAQLVALLMSSDSAEDARLDIEDQLELAEENYAISNTVQQEFNGQEFTVLTYDFLTEGSLYRHGVSAFTVYDSWAMSVELACGDGFGEDPQTVLADFLNHCHYAPMGK